MKTMMLTFLIAAMVSSGSAIPIASWTFETAVQTPASVDPNTVASSFSLGSGSVTFPPGRAPTAPTGISGTGWNVTDGVKWWEFTVTANAGHALDLTSLTFDDRASATGPTFWSVKVNGILAASGEDTHDPISGNTVDLSAIAFQGLTVVEVRIFGYGASAGGGTWRLDNVNLNGTVTRFASVPDSLPFGYAVVALLVVLGLGHRFGRYSPHTA